MAANKKPKTNPKTDFPADATALHRDGDWLWIPLRSEWRGRTLRAAIAALRAR